MYSLMLWLVFLIRRSTVVEPEVIFFAFIAKYIFCGLDEYRRWVLSANLIRCTWVYYRMPFHVFFHQV